LMSGLPGSTIVIGLVNLADSPGRWKVFAWWHEELASIVRPRYPVARSRPASSVATDTMSESWITTGARPVMSAVTQAPGVAAWA
jgi:hypothetical protein